jgi:hypothetical protein
VTALAGGILPEGSGARTDSSNRNRNQTAKESTNRNIAVREEQRSALNGFLKKPPCRDSNPGRRPTAYPLMDKVGNRCLSLTLPPAPSLSMGGRETCRLSSRLQGVGRRNLSARAGRARNWRQTVRSRVSSPSTRRSTRPREAARRVACIPHLGTPASQPGARLFCQHGRTPARARFSNHTACSVLGLKVPAG